MLDSVVQSYFADDDPGKRAQFGERALALVRDYKRDLDRHRAALHPSARAQAARPPANRGRIIDLLIWADQVSPP
jgi:hypothetical protein